MTSKHCSLTFVGRTTWPDDCAV